MHRGRGFANRFCGPCSVRFPRILPIAKLVRFLFHTWANSVFLVTSIYTKLLLEYESHTAAHFSRFHFNIKLLLRIFIQGSYSGSNCSKAVLILFGPPGCGDPDLFLSSMAFKIEKEF